MMLLLSNYEVPLSPLTTWNSEITQQWSLCWAWACSLKERRKCTVRKHRALEGARKVLREWPLSIPLTCQNFSPFCASFELPIKWGEDCISPPFACPKGGKKSRHKSLWVFFIVKIRDIDQQNIAKSLLFLSTTGEVEDVRHWPLSLRTFQCSGRHKADTLLGWANSSFIQMFMWYICCEPPLCVRH